MAKPRVTREVGTVKNILKNVDKFSGRPIMVDDASVTAVNGKKIVMEGSFLNEDGEVATTGIVGVLLHRVDVTYGPEPASVIYRGDIDSTKLPVQPSTITDIADQLPHIQFFDEEYK